MVAFAGPVAGTPVVVVDHGGGLRSTFEPVDATARVGVHVRAGDRWAVPARGWRSRTAPRSCLHWGMLRDGVYVDPLTVTGLRAGCRAVRLLPVDGQDAGARYRTWPRGRRPAECRASAEPGTPCGRGLRTGRPWSRRGRRRGR